MSWSVQFIGKPENVTTALQAQSVKLSGDSKVEFDAALPHFVALVNENFGTDYPIKFVASGHGYTGGEKPNRQLTVSLELLYGMLV